AVPAFATLILALVLGLVYYVSVQRGATEISDIPPQPIPATAANRVPEIVLTPEAQPAAEARKPESRKPEPAAAAVPAKKAVAKPAPTPTKTRVEEKKEDSKV